MMDISPSKPRRGDARVALLDAAHALVRRKGWSATSVDELCTAAGVTKGAFFHHFPSKEALGTAAAEQWTARAQHLIFELPSYLTIEDPLERVLGHIDFRLAMISGPAEDYSCFVGTMVSETFVTSPALRAASDASISAYGERLAQDIQQAIDDRGAPPGITALGLAYHVQAVLQGAFVLAKAKGDPAYARDSVIHLKRYISLLFGKESHP
ncbi:TetR/AcrR family transcriptional regulator [Novosphingobium sp. Gsoil 351]|uniref:TetR/AcrR family transcriptional regulator n=1 Tax=Novosphingobium sp. Gsoil 351 TaxID=2675225 RepID=UPI0012B476EA|nr:TetR/AcrR family transcriptional regulator [Novosphingobium sp. Gsoil 351]QGN53278.1 TetR family transcriptional regulator [Novosphingobium sp. Gsoil 351]